MSDTSRENIARVMIVTDTPDLKEGHIGPKPNDVPTLRQIPQIKPKENNSDKNKTSSNDKK